MKVLVIAPHPDDEAIGCGGAICLHTRRGDRVTTVFLTSGELGLKHLSREEARRVRETEARAAAGVLESSDPIFLRRPDWYLGDAIGDAATALRSVLHHEAPNILYLPHPLEWHPDHRATLPIVRSALDASLWQSMSLRTYEVWTPLSEYDVVENITDVMETKLKAVRCYESQLRDFQYDRAVRGLNEYRGALAARCMYAEVFNTRVAESVNLLSADG